MFIGIETKVLQQGIHICHSEIRGEVAAYEMHTTHAQPGLGGVEFCKILQNLVCLEWLKYTKIKKKKEIHENF